MKYSDFLLKIERITLALFIICMMITAGFFLFLLWTQPQDESLFMVVGTFFVVGLANFLLWLPNMLYRLLNKLP